MTTSSDETKLATETPVTEEKKRVPSWSQLSYGDKISYAQVMVSAARQYLGQLARRGIDDSILGRCDELIRVATDTNNAQESLKGELRKTTAALDTVVSEMGAKLAEIKKMVKVEIPQPEWKKFGIADTH